MSYIANDLDCHETATQGSNTTANGMGESSNTTDLSSNTTANRMTEGSNTTAHAVHGSNTTASKIIQSSNTTDHATQGSNTTANGMVQSSNTTDLSSVTTFKPKQDRGARYLRNRLCTQHPAIFEALERGEHNSIHAAAIVAGIRMATIQHAATVAGFEAAILKHLNEAEIADLVQRLLVCSQVADTLSPSLTEVSSDTDNWETQITEWLKRTGKMRTSFREIADDCLRLSEDEREPPAPRRVADILKSLGWTKIGQKPWGDTKVSTWQAPESADHDAC